MLGKLLKGFFHRHWLLFFRKIFAGNPSGNAFIRKKG